MKENKTLGVILERIENVRYDIKVFKKANEKQHKDLDKNQRMTNGKVRALQVWKAGIAGSVAVLIFVGVMLIRDYIEFRKSYTEYMIKVHDIENISNDAHTTCEKTEQAVEEIINTYYITE